MSILFAQVPLNLTSAPHSKIRMHLSQFYECAIAYETNVTLNSDWDLDGNPASWLPSIVEMLN